VSWTGTSNTQVVSGEQVSNRLNAQMRTRKKELEAIADVLEQEHHDVVYLAEIIWKMIDEMRRERELYVVGVNYQGVGQFLFGAYESETMAIKDYEGRGNIRALKAGDTAKVFKVLAPTKVFADTDEVQGDLFDIR
jgi:hypothetical protein